MTPNERKVYLETRIRNLERRFAKMIAHADLVDESLVIKSEIDSLKLELDSY